MNARHSRSIDEPTAAVTADRVTDGMLFLPMQYNGDKWQSYLDLYTQIAFTDKQPWEPVDAARHISGYVMYALRIIKSKFGANERSVAAGWQFNTILGSAAVVVFFSLVGVSFEIWDEEKVNGLAVYLSRRSSPYPFGHFYDTEMIISDSIIDAIHVLMSY